MPDIKEERIKNICKALNVALNRDDSLTTNNLRSMSAAFAALGDDLSNSDEPKVIEMSKLLIGLSDNIYNVTKANDEGKYEHFKDDKIEISDINLAQISNQISALQELGFAPYVNKMLSERGVLGTTLFCLDETVDVRDSIPFLKDVLPDAINNFASYVVNRVAGNQACAEPSKIDKNGQWWNGGEKIPPPR